MTIPSHDKFNETLRNVKAKLREAESMVDKLNEYFERKSSSDVLTDNEIQKLEYVNNFWKKLSEINGDFPLMK